WDRQQQSQRRVQTLESPEITVDVGTLDRLLNAFPEVSASPTPLKQQQQTLDLYNRTYTMETLPNSAQFDAPKRICSVRLTAEERQQPHGSYCSAAEVQPGGVRCSSTVRQKHWISGTSLVRIDDCLQLQEQDDNSRHQSDSEDAASVASLDSSLSNMQSDSLASTAAKQSGAIRKSGWLNVKNWLVHKKRKVELAPQRAWRRYWVCLKGTVLLFFKDSQQQHQQMMMDAAGERVEPKHSL
uniref:PH domain-containing protein n=1 Tax=Macrostomum lignano TaxID=282301 RepID=A0A1I8F3Z4_9PLAT